MAKISPEPYFDIFSFARPGIGRRDQLTVGQIDSIARTVGRTPEVMIKVLSRGATSTKAVRRHVEYISRKGSLDLKSDEGDSLRSGSAASHLEDWHLDIDEQRPRSDLDLAKGRDVPRLVHKLVFSMPQGTPPGKVLTAATNFCREEFSLKHRYLLALHTNEPHPHVHVVVKAVSEQGQRLHIKKSTLREWREHFADQLRAVGVPANATPRGARGVTILRKSDGLFRVRQRRAVAIRENQQHSIERDPLRGDIHRKSIEPALLRTHVQLEHGWKVIAALLEEYGQPDLANRARRFADEIPRPGTESDKLSEMSRDRTLNRLPLRRDPGR
jgi:hypothetical protein